MVSYWFIWLIHSLIIYQLSFSTKRSSSSALFKTSIPLHLLYNHQYMLCIPLFTAKRRDCFPLSIPGVTGDKYVHLVTVSIHVLFVPPSPPSSYNGARPPAPKLNRLPACFPIYVYICIYPVPYTWQTQSLITESIYVSGLVLIYFYWCIDISMWIHYATLGCTPQIWTNEHDPFSSSIYTPTNRIQMFIIGCCGGPFP